MLQPWEERNLVLLIEPPGEALGSTLATRITYELGGRESQQRTNITMLLSSGDCSGEMEEFERANR